MTYQLEGEGPRAQRSTSHPCLPLQVALYSPSIEWTLSRSSIAFAIRLCNSSLLHSPHPEGSIANRRIPSTEGSSLVLSLYLNTAFAFAIAAHRHSPFHFLPSPL